MIDDYITVLVELYRQVLNFIKKINKGLINTNQWRSFGAQCFENLTDPTSKLAFYLNYVFLTLHMQVTNSLEDYFYPYEY